MDKKTLIKLVKSELGFQDDDFIVVERGEFIGIEMDGPVIDNVKWGSVSRMTRRDAFNSSHFIKEVRRLANG